MGIVTGIDVIRLLKVREILSDALPGEELYGFTAAAGLPLGFDSRVLGAKSTATDGAARRESRAMPP
jgi:hydroxymethylglutaryl-CoA lyase